MRKVSRSCACIRETVTGLDWLIVAFALADGLLGLPAGADRRRAQPGRIRDRRLPRQPARPGAAPGRLAFPLRAGHRPGRGAPDRRDRRRLAGGNRARRCGGACSARRAHGAGSRSPSRPAARCSWSRSRSALAWLFGAVALNAPGAKSLRTAVQRSAILQALNNAFPPSSSLINALHRIDPRVAVQGPEPERRALPTRRSRKTPPSGPRATAWSACSARPVVSASRAPAGSRRRIWWSPTRMWSRGRATPPSRPPARTPPLDATPVHYDPENDLALLRVNGLGGTTLSLRSGRAAAAPPAPCSAIRRTGPSRSRRRASAPPARWSPRTPMAAARSPAS